VVEDLVGGLGSYERGWPHLFQPSMKVSIAVNEVFGRAVGAATTA
jgi:hypothetical protein